MWGRDVLTGAGNKHLGGAVDRHGNASTISKMNVCVISGVRLEGVNGVAGVNGVVGVVTEEATLVASDV